MDPCQNGMASPQVVVGGTVSGMYGGCEYIECTVVDV